MREVTARAALRVVAVSFRDSKVLDLPKALADAVQAALGGFAGEALVLLPGVQDATPQDWQRTVERTGRRWRASVLFETPGRTCQHYRYYEAGADHVRGSIKQTMWKGRTTKPNAVDALLDACRAPDERKFRAANWTAGLLICGENNLLANIESEGNRVVIRHGRRGPVLPGADIVFNGAHSVMGNWGKLERRFEFLSKSRVAIYATNNTSLRSWKASVRIYRNGRLVADGHALRAKTHANVTIVRDATGHDRFRAIYMDLT